MVGGGSDAKTNFMEPTVVSGVKLDDPLMKVLEEKDKIRRKKYKDKNWDKNKDKNRDKDKITKATIWSQQFSPE